eukprot:scaffold27860_cov53-Isochrysis_galbana.AAC.2
MGPAKPAGREAANEPAKGTEKGEEGQQDGVEEGFALEPVGQGGVEDDEGGCAGKIDVRLEEGDHL